jgi:REP element-mobilizing transposase RayT
MREAVYFLTFRTYGTWLHGDERGSVDRANNAYAEPRLPRDDGLRLRRESLMTDSPMLLDTPEKRSAVRLAIERTCAFKQWPLLALNVRTNHVHVVVESSDPIEAVLAGLKARATRALREQHLVRDNRKVWAHHGSTRCLASEASVAAAIDYTLFGQGEALDR